MMSTTNKTNKVTVNEIIESINSKGIINDHNEKEMDMSKVLGVCVLNNGKLGLLMNNVRYYCINEVYMEKDTPHLSEWSISGTVHTACTDMTNPKHIKTFNDTLTFSFNKVNSVHLLDGTVVEEVM